MNGSISTAESFDGTLYVVNSRSSSTLKSLERKFETHGPIACDRDMWVVDSIGRER